MFGLYVFFFKFPNKTSPGGHSLHLYCPVLKSNMQKGFYLVISSWNYLPNEIMKICTKVSTLMGNHTPVGFTAKQLSVTTFSNIWNYFLDWSHGTRFRLLTRTCSVTFYFVFICRHYRSSLNFLFRGIVYRNKRLKHDRNICSTFVCLLNPIRQTFIPQPLFITL